MSKPKIDTEIDTKIDTKIETKIRDILDRHDDDAEQRSPP